MSVSPHTARLPVEELLFRRQFLLSTREEHELPNSNQVLVGGRHIVRAQVDLELTQVESGGKSLTLLGFMLDPDRPEESNTTILRRLLDGMACCEDVFISTASLGGRWAVVTHDGASTMIFHDATGQRQVHYTRDPATGELMCASEPGIMAELLGLTMDPAAVEFIRSRETDDYEIYWMPGDTSLFAEIKALLPNHGLSLETGKCQRFPATRVPVEMNHAESLSESVRLLRGQFESARLRYPLTVPMTAGWDSRLVLALARGLAGDIHAFTLVYPQLPMKSRDVAVPARLLPKLDITHHVIPYPKTLDAGFRAIFRRNNSSANSAYCGDIQALHDQLPVDRVCVTGDAAEIVKCYYVRAFPESVPVSASELAGFSRLGTHPFAVEAFGRWLEEAGDSEVGLMDLFCWEQMAGRWQAKIRAEYDMVQESFSPLNNRRLLGIMLAVDPALRRAPDYLFFREMIEELWPDVLSEPINPPEYSTLKRRLLNVVKKTGVLKLVPAPLIKRAKALVR